MTPLCNIIKLHGPKTSEKGERFGAFKRKFITVNSGRFMCSQV